MWYEVPLYFIDNAKFVKVYFALQEVSDQELEEVEVEGTGMVGGTYRLLATGPSGPLSTYITDMDSSDEVSDIEVSHGVH